jgi:hypothetical protein
MNAERISTLVRVPPLTKPAKGLQRAPLTDAADVSDTAPPIVKDVLRSMGQPLDAATCAYMQPRFGHDFSGVRVHTDSEAAASAKAVNARAYTVGKQIAFNAGAYRPDTSEGRHLLAHELTHTLQQSGNSGQPSDRQAIDNAGDATEREAVRVSGETTQGTQTGNPLMARGPVRTSHSDWGIQRDLVAYSKEHSEILPSFGDSGGVSYQVFPADAASVEAALQPLVMAGRVGTRVDGDKTYFFDAGTTRREVLSAFRSAGFARASDMADALIAQQNTSIYSRNEVTKFSGLFTFELGNRTNVVERQLERAPTNFERQEARLVFGDNLNYDQITLAEDPILGSFGYARTLPRTVYFPPGSFGGPNYIPWLIHELAHSWQYQHGVSIFKTIYHAVGADYDYGAEAGLRAASAAGRTLTSFTTEEQGSIAADYYTRLKNAMDVMAWVPFINEFKGIAAPSSTPTPRTPARTP